VAITAFENGSHFTTANTGTVKHVKLVSCVAGNSSPAVANGVV
jgi:hypothetical protein